MNDLDDYDPSERIPNLKITSAHIGLELIEEWSCCKQVWRNHSEVIQHVESIHPPIKIFETEFKCQQCSHTVDYYKFGIGHFLSAHVCYEFRCTKCMIGHSYFGRFLEHLDYCNSYFLEKRNREIQQFRQTRALRPFREPH